MYNECKSRNFFLLAKNPCTTHNIYQYVNKEHGKKIKMQWKQTKHTNKRKTLQV